MQKIKARCIFPGKGKPVPDGILVLGDDGTILALLDPAKDENGGEDAEFHDGILCPGFINTHCHLELSWKRGTIARGTGLHAFILSLMSGGQGKFRELQLASVAGAEEEMLRNGIVAVADIVNTDITCEVKKIGRLVYHNLVEAFGSDPARAAAQFRLVESLYQRFMEFSGEKGSSIVPHATYSVSMPLMDEIRKFAEAHSCLFSIHHLENGDEVDYFRDKTGNIPSRMKTLGVDISGFKPTGKRPLASLLEYLPVRNHMLLVHNTEATREDVDIVRENLPQVWWCLCPGANLFIEQKAPPVDFLRESGARITLGTDSLASNNTLSILEEMKTLSVINPKIPVQELIRWATVNGAEYLRLDGCLGSFEPGKKPGVNLILGTDPVTHGLTAGSAVRVLK